MARFAVPALSALLAMNVSAQSPPPLLQIVQERLNSDAEPAYGKIEEQLAPLCARINAPNRYLAACVSELAKRGPMAEYLRLLSGCGPRSGSLRTEHGADDGHARREVAEEGAVNSLCWDGDALV